MPTKYHPLVSISLTFRNKCKGKYRLSLSENQLIKSAQAGDREAFSSLAQRFERRVYTLALYYTRERADAEDLAQEVWLKVYRALHTFKGEASFYTWLRQIMVNTFLNHRRKEIFRWGDHHATALELDANDDAGSDLLNSQLDKRAAGVEEEYDRRILVERVFQALGELTAQQRLIFLLKHREGMTYEEIAKTFNCSTGTIKKTLFRAVAKLRQQLGVEPAPLEYAQCGAGRNS
jgi:RNA polymerase sigma-70 factor (ECF subfamily)